ncbi:ATP-binding protein [Actinoplanes sp. NPDC051851]|uniref:ATP-binding protein n=1 Tax=Actinoplanes sp. NPDC051851 TaxID=3154753 RepID=UPI003449257D
MTRVPDTLSRPDVTGLAALLESLPIGRVLELPRRPRPHSASDGAVRQRLAAVVAAYHGGAPLLLGWHRAAESAPVEVFAAGGVTGRTGPGGRVPMSVPPGAVGHRYPGGDLPGRLRAVPAWTRVAGLTDGLLAEDGAPEPGVPRPNLDEGLLHVWQGPFSWFVLAVPETAAGLATATRMIAAEERQARSHAQSPEHAIATARLQRRHRELQQGRSTGMWRIHLLAGGDSPASAAAVAGLLCASADLTHLPYALMPAAVAGDLDDMLAAEDTPDTPVLGSSALLAALAAVPLDEVPGLRTATRPDFDVTPETAGHDGPAVRLGAVLDRALSPVGPLDIPRSSLNRHTFVCGATGAGKSQTVRNLLESASAQGLPWLVVEPAKAEYRRMADRIGGDRVITIRPGDPGTPPAGFNPLRPADGFPLQTHLDLTRSLFLAAFEADEPFPQVLSAALSRCYQDLGWDLALGEPRTPGHRPRYPTLGDLQHTAEQVIDRIGYGKEITANVRGFIRVRLASLRLGTTGGFFEGGHPLDLAALMRHNVVFEIEDVGDDRDKAFLMGGLLIQLTEHLRVETRRNPELLTLGLRHLSVFEEAHRLLRRTEERGPASHAVELFAALLAEIRAYGEGLIIAEQIPGKLIPDVIKNTAVKIIHRLPAADDREAVGATANLTDTQSAYLVTLPPGTAAVFTDGMDQPVLTGMPDGSPRERGGRTPTANATAVIARRSPTCGPKCATTACTLREMRTAQHLLEDEPWLAAWAELATLGHLAGGPAPIPRAHRLRQLLLVPTRLRDCALSQAVDEAVRSRSTVLGDHAGPEATARHLLDVAHGYLNDEFRCAVEEPEYLARPYRWQLISDELTEAARTDGAAPRHPRSAGWERETRRTIPGTTVGDQAAAVTTWLDHDLADPGPRRTVALGSRDPTPLERAVGTTFGSPDWNTRIRALIEDDFEDDTWLLRFLIPA